MRRSSKKIPTPVDHFKAEILSLVQANPGIKKGKIARLLNQTQACVHRRLKELELEGAIYAEDPGVLGRNAGKLWYPAVKVS